MPKEQADRARAQLNTDAQALDKSLEGKRFLVGDGMTIADLLIFCALISAF